MASRNAKSIIDYQLYLDQQDVRDVERRGLDAKAAAHAEDAVTEWTAIKAAARRMGDRDLAFEYPHRATGIYAVDVLVKWGVIDP